MNRIMVATDFSERSDRALRRATLLARQSGASLILVNAIDDDRPQHIFKEEKRQAEALLRELASTVRSVDGVECEARVVLSEPSEAIGQAARDIAPDILVIGPHRRHIFRDIFIGTTAERTIRAASCPVLMVNAAPVGPYRHFLATTDLSEASGNAIAAYSRLKLAEQALQSVLHVFSAPLLHLAVSRAMAKEERQSYIDDERKKASLALSKFMKSAKVSGFKPVLRHEDTTAKAEILAAAEEMRSDLILVATHSKRGLERYLLGSVTEQVLRDSPVDVLAIPPGVS
jgi:nucleotide-binding universal stress UspA family protein